jgi:hypothetical protein
MRVSATGLIQALYAAGGVLRVADPDDAGRRAYRRAIHAAKASGAVPEGSRLRHSGRDRGDMVIRLVKLPDASRPAKPQPVPVPVVHADAEPALAEVDLLLGSRDTLKISAQLRPRAERILQALAQEAARRGHGVEPGVGGVALVLVVDGQRLPLTLSEEDDKVDVVEPDDLAARRFSWQRISPRQGRVPSGRLVLRLDHYSGRQSWADRSRWRLEDRLGHALAHIESVGHEMADRRRQARNEGLRALETWEAAVFEARRRYAEAVNRERMQTEAADSGRAQALRSYAERITSAASPEVDPGLAAHMLEWRRLIVDEAERIDPLNRPTAMGLIEPADVKPEDLAPFMPAGMSIYRRPLIPD